jgi:tripartite-type tricarboxylate transporter receptor subunit TctC
VLIASKNVRAGNLQQLIEEVRAQPGKFTYGGGIASPPHVMGAWFNRLNYLNVVHVPYRGGGQAVADVVGGHIDMFYAGLAAAKAAIDSGAVNAFAVTGDTRSSALPTCRPSRRRG